MNNYDVCIAGGGIVGLTLAALLARQSLRVALLEPRPLPVSPEPGQGDYALRVSAINLASMCIFSHLGISDNLFDARASGYRRMQVWDANSDASVEFQADDIDREYLGYIIENDLIVNELYKLIESFPDTTVYTESLKAIDQKTDTIDVQLSKARLRCKLLVGADGQHSMVRTLAGMPTDMGLFNQTALVCRIGTEHAHEQTAYQCFHHSGPIAYLPLADGSSSIVWSCDSDKVSNLTELSDAAFAEAVEEAMQSALGRVKVLSPRAGFDLAQQHARRYIDSNIALVGDAAHRTHPLAGLGANLGLQDAAALAECIELAVEQQRPINGHVTLRRYERARKHQNALVLDTMQAFKTGFSSRSPALSALRAMALNTADNMSPLKQKITRLATGLSGDLPRVCRV